MVDDARRIVLQRSASRTRFGFGVAAVLLPLVLHLLFDRQNRALSRLVVEGRSAEATFDSISGINGEDFAQYDYLVGAERHTSSVERRKVSGSVGETFPIVFLPDRPAFCALAPFTVAEVSERVDLAFQRNVLVGLFVFLAGIGVWSHVSLGRLRRGQPLRHDSRLSPQALGRILAVVFLAIGLSVNRYDDVRHIASVLWGERALGLPVMWVVSLVEVLLFLPYLWVLPQLMVLVMKAQERGGVSKGAVIMAVVRAEPAHRRAQLIVIGGFVYFVAIVGAWIAYTSYRGV